MSLARHGMMVIHYSYAGSRQAFLSAFRALWYDTNALSRSMHWARERNSSWIVNSGVTPRTKSFEDGDWATCLMSVMFYNQEQRNFFTSIISRSCRSFVYIYIMRSTLLNMVTVYHCSSGASWSLSEWECSLSQDLSIREHHDWLIDWLIFFQRIWLRLNDCCMAMDVARIYNWGSSFSRIPMLIDFFLDSSYCTKCCTICRFSDGTHHTHDLPQESGPLAMPVYLAKRYRHCTLIPNHVNIVSIALLSIIKSLVVLSLLCWACVQLILTFVCYFSSLFVQCTCTAVVKICNGGAVWELTVDYENCFTIASVMHC